MPETTASGEYVQYSADLSAYAGQQGYIAIHHMHTEMDDWLIVDDFGIYIQEDPDGWETINHIAGNTFVINGLTPETIYEWQVQGVSPECPDGVTDWSRNPRFATTTASRYQLDIVGHGGNEGRWYLIALPVQETTAPTSVVNLIAQPAENYDLYRFNQSAEMEWENYKQEGDHYHFDLENGQGYLYANANDVTLAFTGTPYYNGTQPGDVTITLRKDDDAQWAGWNLIGNPFCRQVNFNDKDFYCMNGDGTDLILGTIKMLQPMEGVFVLADYESRFKLVFATKDGPSTSSGTFAYYNGSEWMINNTGEATLQVVDVLGHVLHSETINGNATFSANDLSAGVYVMRLVAGEYVKTQKIVVR